MPPSDPATELSLLRDEPDNLHLAWGYGPLLVGLVLFALAAHCVGWPFPRGGSQALSDALAGYLRELGGEIVTDVHVRSWEELPPARAYLRIRRT